MQYNDNMKTITINSDRVSTYDAILWASKQFGSNFSVQHEFPGKNWRFDFNNSKEAILFALKWSQ
jgi:hypothetical protein